MKIFQSLQVFRTFVQAGDSGTGFPAPPSARPILDHARMRKLRSWERKRSPGHFGIGQLPEGRPSLTAELVRRSQRFTRICRPYWPRGNGAESFRSAVGGDSAATTNTASNFPAAADSESTSSRGRPAWSGPGQALSGGRAGTDRIEIERRSVCSWTTPAFGRTDRQIPDHRGQALWQALRASNAASSRPQQVPPRVLFQVEGFLHPLEIHEGEVGAPVWSDFRLKRPKVAFPSARRPHGFRPGGATGKKGI